MNEIDMYGNDVLSYAGNKHKQSLINYIYMAYITSLVAVEP